LSLLLVHYIASLIKSQYCLNNFSLTNFPSDILSHFVAHDHFQYILNLAYIYRVHLKV